jgi:hypothetical protein
MAFDITSENGKEKWTSYRFTKNIYDHFMPMHHARICSVIDDLVKASIAKSTKSGGGIDKRWSSSPSQLQSGCHVIDTIG